MVFSCLFILIEFNSPFMRPRHARNRHPMRLLALADRETAPRERSAEAAIYKTFEINHKR
jgi:hypothetical protein